MYKLAFSFLIASLLSALVGFSGLATTGFIAAFAGVAQLLFFVFIVFFVVLLILGREMFA
jgi:uncharacterized membrane protein YtjA (UPF0391 family)